MDQSDANRRPVGTVLTTRSAPKGMSNDGAKTLSSSILAVSFGSRSSGGWSSGGRPVETTTYAVRRERWRGFLFAQRSACRDRKLAASLQHRTPACTVDLQTADARSLHSDLRRAGGCATPTNAAAGAGSEANDALTYKLEPSLGADQQHTAAPMNVTGVCRGPSWSWL